MFFREEKPVGRHGGAGRSIIPFENQLGARPTFVVVLKGSTESVLVAVEDRLPPTP